MKGAVRPAASAAQIRSKAENFRRGGSAALSNLKKLGSRKICILRVYSMAIITAALAE